jgi:hypothetical protein
VSVAATNYVWERSPAEGADRLVLLALADFADEAGNCFGSWGKLEEKTRLARATIARSVKRLQASGELVMVERGHRKLAGNGAEATIWKIPAVSEMGLTMRPVSERDPSSVRMRPKWYQNETPTIRNNKERNNTEAQETLSPSLPPQSGDGLKPRKKAAAFDPLSIPLPHRSGFATAWSEFVQHRREIKAPLTPTATKRILASLGAVNEAIACEALGKSVRHGWRGVFPESAAPQQPPTTPVASPKWVDLSMYTQPRKEVA